MEECYETNGTELLHIRKFLKAKSQLKSFHCVFNFEDEKVESADFPYQDSI